MQVGEVFPLRAAVRDQNNGLMNRPVRWSSSNPRIASVGRDGRLVALAEGTTTVTAESDGQRRTTDVVVTAVIAARVALSPTGATIDVGERLVIAASVFDADSRPLTDRTPAWQSSNENVASVSAGGTVVGVGPGSATITATSGGASGSARIEVRAPVVAAPPAAPANSTVTSPPAPAPQEAIAQLVEAYAAALQSKVIARVRTLYPDMTPQQVRDTQVALDAMQGLRVQLRASDIEVTGSEAHARVTGQWVYNRGERLNYNQTFEFELRPEGWRIIAIR
jgi:hypothetical protein